MSRYAIDTSVALPLVMSSHPERGPVVRWARSHDLSVSGHALAESYSVLTRLPGDARLLPQDAARVLSTRFGQALLLPPSVGARLPDILAAASISGGAVYDALVALAAKSNDVVLATRDARATATYEAVGARFEIVS